jgi:hypothetical protein
MVEARADKPGDQLYDPLILKRGKIYSPPEGHPRLRPSDSRTAHRVWVSGWGRQRAQVAAVEKPQRDESPSQVGPKLVITRLGRSRLGRTTAHH